VEESEGHRSLSNANRSEQSDGCKLFREIQHLVHNFFSGKATVRDLREDRERGIGVIVVDMGSTGVFSRGIIFIRTGEETGTRLGSLIGLTVD